MKRKTIAGSAAAAAALLFVTALVGWHHTQANAAQPRAIATPAANIQYVASRARQPFHRPDCNWAQKVSAKNLQVFETREQAIAAGHRPCKVCRP